MMVQHDYVVTTLQVFDGGHCVVAFGQVGTSGTCVGTLEAKAMGQQ